MSSAVSEKEMDEGGEHVIPEFEVQDVPSTAPIKWLKAGIADFKQTPKISLKYGFIYVGLGLLMMLLLWANPFYVVTMVACFFLAGPIVAVGFYCISRAIEKGEEPTFELGIESMRFNSVSLASFAFVLAFIVGAWVFVATVLVALFFNSVTIGPDVWSTILSNKNVIPFVISYFAIGLVFAIIAFSVSVVSAPLITNRRTDVVTAMITSVKAVKKNPVAMFSWALMITTLITVGMMFFYVGLAITLPIAGHATWHAYRDLVKDKA